MSFWLRTHATVYILIDPRDELVRYVGCSEAPERRLEQHLYEHDSNTGKRMWIDGLLREGMEPRLEMLETVPANHASDREQRWIVYFLIGQDMPLLNLTGIPRRHLRRANQIIEELEKRREKEKSVA